MVLGMRTTVLMTVFRLTSIRLHIASKQYAWRIHLQKNVMVAPTYVPGALKLTTLASSDQLPTVCENSVSYEPYLFSFRNFGQLAGPNGDATFIHVANSVLGVLGGGGGGVGVEFVLFKYSM
jgi:hypothetical protein